MPLAPVIGTSLADSAVLDPSLEPSDYRLQVFKLDPGNSYGRGDLIADVVRFQNLGYADYLNDVPEMFFTLQQDDDQLPGILDHLGKAHYLLWRGKRVVHAGWLMEDEEADDDVVVYGYGYLAGLYWSLSNWDQTFTSQPISEIARLLWRFAVTINKSLLGWIPPGTIEGALTSGGGSGQMVLPEYRLFYKRLLFAFQELAAAGASDTFNNVVFEITHEEQPRFNFWRNKGTRRPGMRLTYGDGGQIVGFRRGRRPVFRRNDVKGVGSTPQDLIARKDATDLTDIDEWGRRQEPLFLAWVRDETELERVTKFRQKHIKRGDYDLALRLAANSVIPPGGLGAQFEKGDALPVQIKRGATRIDQYMMVAGYQVVYDGAEHMNLLLQDERRPNLQMVGLPTTIVNDSTYAAFPDLARMANGNLICVYRTGTDHIGPPNDGKIVGKISTDNGVTWGSQFDIWDDDTLDLRDPAVSVMSDGTIVVSSTTYDGSGGVASGEFLAYIVKSTDNGTTWSNPIAIGSSLADQREVGGSRVIELPDGRWMAPICGRISSEDDDTERVSVVFSDDAGETWGDETVVAHEAGQFYTEPVMCLLPDGTIHCLIRENAEAVIYRTVSTDNGATWSDLTEVFDSQTKPMHALLNDGTMLACIRSGGGSNLDVVYRTSANLGASWSDETPMAHPRRNMMYAGIVADYQYKALVAYGAEGSSQNSDIFLQRFA